MTHHDDTWPARIGGSRPEQQAALAELREALLRNLRRALWQRNVTDEALLEDLVQESLVRIVDRLNQFEGRSRFLTWATAIAIRVALSELRRRHWSEVSLEAIIADRGFAPGENAVAGQAIDSAMQRRALVATLYELIGSELTDRQRTALLAELKGMPQDEIARQLGSSRNALYKLTHDARKRLKQGLSAAGYDAADIHAAFAR